MVKSLAPFEEWPFQDGLVRTLYERLGQGAVPHTMLFVGDPHNTKEMTEYLARLLLCRAEHAPCGHCESCIQFQAGNHPDHVVLGNEEGATVKTGQVEQLQNQLKLRAHGGGHLVYVIPGIDNATAVAANRLLKTLEEPEAPVIAFLTATSLGRVLPTIVSRSFVFRIGESKDNFEWDDPFKAFPNGEAESQENDGFATLLKPVLQWTGHLLRRSEAAVLLADSFLKDTSAVPPDVALQILSLWLRDVMHHGLGDLLHIRFLEFESELQEQSSQRTSYQFATMIQVVLEARTRLRAHVNPALNIEQMCIRLQEVT